MDLLTATPTPPQQQQQEEPEQQKQQQQQQPEHESSQSGKDPCSSKGSSLFSSMESLADMTACPVHCGRLERPKLLPCGHVFCLACLDKWSQRQAASGQGGGQFECPMCRRRVARPPAGLPNALAHQAILDYLVSHAAARVKRQRRRSGRKRGRCRESSPASPDERPSRPRRQRSLEMRQDLLAHLSDDLLLRADAGTSPPEGFDRAELASVRDNLGRVLQRLEAASAAATASAAAATPPHPLSQSPSATALTAREATEEEEEEEGEEDNEQAAAAATDSFEEDDDEDDDDEDSDVDSGPQATTAATATAEDFSATQREMHRLSRYRVRELPIAWSEEDEFAEDRDRDRFAGDGEIAGAGLLSRRPQSPQDGRRSRRRRRHSRPQLVLLGGRSHRLLVQRWRGGSDPRSLAQLTIDQLTDLDGGGSHQRLQVASLQTVRGLVYLTGWSGRRSILAIVSASTIEEAGGSGGGGGGGACRSSVLRCHTREEASEAAAADGFAGFHVEPPGDVVVAQPGRQRVEFFAEDLRPTGHWLVFDRLRPRHVAWARQSETLWVSCPDERLVLAVNDRTGVFRKLNTGEIFLSAPGPIVAVPAASGAPADCRVVLAEPELGRLFWIRKRRKFIFLQRLQLPQELPPITGLCAAEDGRLLVASRDRLFRLKPARTTGGGGGGGGGGGHRVSLKCQLL